MSLNYGTKIHQAAANGNLKQFKAQVAKKFDPFSLNNEGFTPLYLAEINSQNKIVNWYEKYYPANFPVLTLNFTDDIAKLPDNLILDREKLKNFLKLDELINLKLRSCGLRRFVVQFPRDLMSIAELLSQLFESIHQFTNVKRKIGKDVWDETQLSCFVFGMIEEIKPDEFLQLLTYRFSYLNQQQQALCLFLIKEIIKQDADNEYLKEDFFKKILDTFFKNAKGSDALKKLDILDSIKTYYELKCDFAFQLMRDLQQEQLNFATQDFQREPEVFVQDLCKLMSDKILALTALNFCHNRLSANNNFAWKDLLRTTNDISHMVTKHILSVEPKDRITQFNFYIDCINKCIKKPYFNFDAAFAIHAGLNCHPVAHLPSFNVLIPTSHKTLFERTASNPGSLSDIVSYASYKTSVSENMLQDRVPKYGLINWNYYQNRFYALQRLVNPFQTNLMKALNETASTYNEHDIYHAELTESVRDIYTSKTRETVFTTSKPITKKNTEVRNRRKKLTKMHQLSTESLPRQDTFKEEPLYIPLYNKKTVLTDLNTHLDITPPLVQEASTNSSDPSSLSSNTPTIIQGHKTRKKK